MEKNYFSTGISREVPWWQLGRWAYGACHVVPARVSMCVVSDADGRKGHSRGTGPGIRCATTVGPELKAPLAAAGAGWLTVSGWGTRGKSMGKPRGILCRRCGKVSGTSRGKSEEIPGNPGANPGEARQWRQRGRQDSVLAMTRSSRGGGIYRVQDGNPGEDVSGAPVELPGESGLYRWLPAGGDEVPAWSPVSNGHRMGGGEV